MYAAPPPASESLPFTNGHLPSPTTKRESSSAVASDSESALSDAIDDPTSLAPNLDVEAVDDRKENDREIFGDDSSQEDDVLASDDPDYDAESSLPNNATEANYDARSMSSESPRERKRKLSFDTDEHIKNDPELYGIRRSVRGKASSDRRC